MNGGQRQALDELGTVAAAYPPAVEILSSRVNGPTLVIEIAMDCAGVTTSARGIQVRSRERFTVFVPETFPLEPPSVKVAHRRWHGHHHVQFGSTLCLYQAPTTEWVPSDGMFGFLERLWSFVNKAAQDRLDEWGAPLHPPVAYTSGSSPSLVIKADAPIVEPPWWLGLAKLEIKSERRFDVTAWPTSEEAGDGPHAAAFLLSQRFPFEYPDTVRGLIAALLSVGISRRLLLLTLEAAALRVEEGQPLVVLVGTPMRGVRGQTTVQHLAAWCVPPAVASCLRLGVLKFHDHEDFRQLGEKAEAIAVDWTDEAATAWCAVYEDRPETTRRRDDASPMAAFRGINVTLWGCGALGSAVAEHLTRAGVGRLTLRDRARVGPGLLVRQRFDDLDVGRDKGEALADRIRRIDPALEVVIERGNVLSAGFDGQWGSADVLIDTTASPGVAALIERARSEAAEMPTVASLMVGHICDRGLVTVVRPESLQGPLSATRAAKLASCRDPTLAGFADEFWPMPPRVDVFQPEPGCSDATFRGSAAEIDVLAALMLLKVGREIEQPGGGLAFVANPVTAPAPYVARPTLDAPFEIIDERIGYRVLIDAAARDEITAAIAQSRARHGPRVETGGVLFGQRDDAARIIWVSVATGPPADSRASTDGFVCGIEGIDDLAITLKVSFRDAVVPIGMWHTHPDDTARPSRIDESGMAKLLTSAERPQRRQLLYIIGRREQEHRAFLYDRDELSR